MRYISEICSFPNSKSESFLLSVSYLILLQKNLVTVSCMMKRIPKPSNIVVQHTSFRKRIVITFNGQNFTQFPKKTITSNLNIN